MSIRALRCFDKTSFSNTAAIAGIMPRSQPDVVCQALIRGFSNAKDGVAASGLPPPCSWTSDWAQKDGTDWLGKRQIWDQLPADSSGEAFSFRGERDILEVAIQAAPRPRKGIIPPELLSSTEHQPHFSL